MFDLFGPLAYFSPETMLPLTSMIATVVGCALLIKRSSVRFVVHCCRAAFRKPSSGTGLAKPHLNVRAGQSRERNRT